jgi:SAM-dependent methyltransferase
VALSNLIAYDKAICLERLEKATTEELWDVFLVGQAELNFTTEFHWVSNKEWWQKAENVLDIGCGNGAYLSKVANQFPEKKFLGIEKLPLSVTHANERYASNGVTFEEGDAEVLHEPLTSTADVILFRLVLQHLQKPLLALQNSWHYLAPKGYVLIIDSYDPAKRTSHPISELDHLLALVAEKQANSDKGHRKISLEVLQQIENQRSPLSELYRVVFTNLDVYHRPLNS